MSDHSHDTDHDEAHTGPIRNPKQLLIAVFYAFVIPVAIIIGLVATVTSNDKTAVGASNPEKAKAERIMKVGSVEVRDANREMKNGQAVYTEQCSGCHTAGALGAPKLGDAGAWSGRIKSGFDALVQSALKGKNGMPAQGGGNFEDIEIARAVAYLANAGGASFTEPAQPKAAEAAPAADAAK